MLLFIVNNAIFLHVHKLSDGTIVEHAHPYDFSNDSEPYKSHHHSNAEFLFFQNLKILFLIIFTALALIVFLKKEPVLFKFITKPTLICINLHKGRAPPIA